MKANQIAIQTFTVREQVAADVLGTLRTLAGMGYRAVEFSALGDVLSQELADALGVGQWGAASGSVSPEELRATLDDFGMRTVSVAIGFPPEASLGRLADFAHTLGTKYAVMAWVPEERRRNAEDVRRLVEYVNELGRKLREYGLQFVYHNHDFEFAPVEGSSRNLYEMLALETDPALVKFEPDVYWLAYAGKNPADMIREHADRIVLLHMKDMAADERRGFETVGAGVLDWPSIVDAAREAHVEWYVMEHDEAPDPMQAAESALRFMQGLAD